MNEQTFVLDTAHGAVHGVWQPCVNPRGVVVLCTDPNLPDRTESETDEPLPKLADAIAAELEDVAILTYTLVPPAGSDEEIEIQAYAAAGKPAPAWWRDDLNNARLVSMSLYHGLLPAFRALLAQCDADLQCFYAMAREISELAPEAREARLSDLQS